MTDWNNPQQVAKHKSLLFQQILRNTFYLFANIDGIPDNCKSLNLSSQTVITSDLLRELVNRIPDEESIGQSTEEIDGGNQSDTAGSTIQFNAISPHIEQNQKHHQQPLLYRSAPSISNRQVATTTSIANSSNSKGVTTSTISQEQEEFFSETKKKIPKKEQSFFDDLSQEESEEYPAQPPRRRRKPIHKEKVTSPAVPAIEKQRVPSVTGTRNPIPIKIRYGNQKLMNDKTPQMSLYSGSRQDKLRVAKYFLENYDPARRNKIEVVYKIVQHFNYTYTSVYHILTNELSELTAELEKKATKAS